MPVWAGPGRPRRFHADSTFSRRSNGAASGPRARACATPRPDYNFSPEAAIDQQQPRAAAKFSRIPTSKIIRGVYAFHTEIRKWSDIKDNFLVDRFGRIWEGRAGGWTRWSAARPARFNADHLRHRPGGLGGLLTITGPTRTPSPTRAPSRARGRSTQATTASRPAADRSGEKPQIRDRCRTCKAARIMTSGRGAARRRPGPTVGSEGRGPAGETPRAGSTVQDGRAVHGSYGVLRPRQLVGDCFGSPGARQASPGRGCGTARPTRRAAQRRRAGRRSGPSRCSGRRRTGRASAAIRPRSAAAATARPYRLRPRLSTEPAARSRAAASGAGAGAATNRSACPATFGGVVQHPGRGRHRRAPRTPDAGRPAPARRWQLAIWATCARGRPPRDRSRAGSPIGAAARRRCSSRPGTRRSSASASAATGRSGRPAHASKVVDDQVRGLGDPVVGGGEGQLDAFTGCVVVVGQERPGRILGSDRGPPAELIGGHGGGLKFAHSRLRSLRSGCPCGARRASCGTARRSWRRRLSAIGFGTLGVGQPGRPIGQE